MYLMKHKVMLLLLIATLSFVWAVPREMVVLEIGTGTWCPYCPGASMGAHDLLEAGYNVAVETTMAILMPTLFPTPETPIMESIASPRLLSMD